MIFSFNSKIWWLEEKSFFLNYSNSEIVMRKIIICHFNSQSIYIGYFTQAYRVEFVIELYSIKIYSNTKVLINEWKQ